MWLNRVVESWPAQAAPDLLQTTNTHLHSHTHKMIPYVVRRRPAKLFLINDFFFILFFPFCLYLSCRRQGIFVVFCRFQMQTLPRNLSFLFFYIVYCLCSCRELPLQRWHKTKRKTKKKNENKSKTQIALPIAPLSDRFNVDDHDDDKEQATLSMSMRCTNLCSQF